MIHALRQKPACLDSYAKLNPSFVSVKENFTSVAGYSTPPSMGVCRRNSSWISGQRSISFPTCSAKSGSAKTASDWSMCPSIRRIVWSTSRAPKVGWADMVCTLDRCWSHESLKLKIAPNHDTFSHHGFRVKCQRQKQAYYLKHECPRSWSEIIVRLHECWQLIPARNHWLCLSCEKEQLILPHLNWWIRQRCFS